MGAGEPNAAPRSLSPPRAGKRARALSYLQSSALSSPSSSSHALYSSAPGVAGIGQNGLFGFAGAKQQQALCSFPKDRAEQELVELRREVN